MDLIILMIGGVFSGQVMKKAKIPGGMMIGSLIFVMIYVNFIKESQKIDINLGLISQVTAGVCIGVKISKNDLVSISKIYKEIILISISLLTISVISGILLHFVFGLNAPDAFIGSIPGGMTSIPLIGIDYGANPINVTTLQFVRMIVGIVFFPRFLTKYLNLTLKTNKELVETLINKKKIKEKAYRRMDKDRNNFIYSFYWSNYIKKNRSSNKYISFSYFNISII